MTRAEIIQPTEHAKLRIVRGHGASFGETAHFVPVVAEELRALVLEYPVFIMKDEDTGQFGLNALLGLAPGENLYLRDDGWNASYLPIHIQRQPFLVANTHEGEGKIALDMASSRVSQTEGEPLFDENGNATGYLESMRALLSRLMLGIRATQAFLDKLVELDLIEAKQLTISLPGGEQKRFAGFYSINEQRLQALAPDQLQAFYASGYLQASYLLLASAGNVQKLVAAKVAR
ncbi:SapC family protein [Simiduia agarivorans]|uniref:SapC family protein n=1 Tax=Simiduia agarivorans (strain DSM 21679 / JCM 13881 / BCRC 17597 / SA1) TaxID=1117647 RepID=K4KNA9_SIMAS|nr:SapC family protein [Simiduia agarivorans]AFV00532.1 SapC family protein [Simiduia agarivorans SA1 = DSM 21679]